MQLHIWGWFMLFTVIVFVLLWVCQIVFLQNFYDRMKTKDVIETAHEMLEIYQTGDYKERFDEISSKNDMCVEIRDRYRRPVYSKDVLGVGCFIHGLNNHTGELLDMLKDRSDGVIYGKQTNSRTQLDVLVYACAIGSAERPDGYLLLNTPLVPVSSTVDILKRQLIIITALLAGVSVLFSVLVAKWLSKPIVQVTKDAEELAHGRYDIVFQGGRYSEADKLAQTLTYASHEINRVDTMQRDLIANASHDLRTPLTMVKAYAEMIRDISGDDPEKRSEHLAVIIDETDRLTLLVNDILDLSKLENGKMTLTRSTFDICARLLEIVERYQGLSEVSGYQFELKTDGEAYVCCDAGKIEQVICNLINNAVNYSGEEKRITITQEHTPQGIRISVRDTGEGMDQETISKIFDKYYRSENHKREIIGTGLGLSIVKAILCLHDYAFGVDSRIGEGSTFWFIIHDVAEKP